MTFKVGKKEVGDNTPIFTIAEAGINHIGLFDEAKEMVEVANRSKADAVTFQHIRRDEINSNQINGGGKKLDWDKWCLSNEQMTELFNQAHYRDLAVTACVVSMKSLDFIVKAGADFIKIVSGDLTCHPFLAECARTGLPLFMSTGNALMEEIEEAINTIEKSGGKKIVVYQTNSKYPTPPWEVDLKSLDILKKFGYPVGFCDHTEGTAVPLAASALGAKVIEKHFSLNPSLIRPDYEVSLNPAELSKLVSDIRIIESALGDPVKKRYVDEGSYVLVRRSVVANQDLPKGTCIQQAHIAYKRPGTGMKPAQALELIGRSLREDVKRNQQLTKEMFSCCIR